MFKIDGRPTLAEGFHRYAAAVDLGLKEMAVKVHEGTREDALAYAVTANAKNGANLKSSDRIAGIKRLLILGWTQEAVADAVGVSVQAISSHGNSLRLRGELPAEPPNREGRGRTGKVVKPLPAAVSAPLSDTALARVAQLPEAAQEPVARIAGEAKLTEREIGSVVAAAKAGADPEETVLEVVFQKNLKAGRKAAVAQDEAHAVESLLHALLHVMQFSPVDAAQKGVAVDDRDLKAVQFAEGIRWESAFLDALSERGLKVVSG